MPPLKMRAGRFRFQLEFPRVRQGLHAITFRVRRLLHRGLQFPQPAQIPRRIRQAVGMIDAQPVDESLGEPTGHFGVAGLEDRAVFLTPPSQRSDRK